MRNGLRNVAILFVMVGVLATACTEESREKIREALPSGVSGLPSALPIPSPSDGPTGGEPEGTTGPTGPTGPIGTPTQEPTEPPTESPAEPTEDPTPGQGALILAIISILERLLGDQPPPNEQPSPIETPPPESTTGPDGEPATGPTGGSTGVTSAVAGPTGPTETAGSGEGDASEAVVQAAVSSTTEDPTWVWIVFLAVLGGLGWFLWWRARRGRAHPD